MYSSRGPGAITTPAACSDALRAKPSSTRQYSISFLIWGSVDSLTQRSSGPSIASAIGCTRPNLTVIFSVIELMMFSGMPSTRPTSFRTAREESVPNVMIWETALSPYFFFTYSITISRLLSEKSISISGIDTRSGFRKRSKRRSYFRGSTLVMPRAYATMLPAALPRPGPTRTP